nr:AAA family ATPase [uncultured Cellulosilyticum sp.]
MKLTIKSLSLSNFKGVKQLNLMLDSTEVRLHGANGSGKTTVADAHSFALTGNDSTGAKANTITLDADNNKVYGANEVIEVLDVDGTEISLGRKVITKLGKSKGEEVEKTTYEYTINGAQLKATEYEAYIREHITKGRIDSKEFLILTNPTAFQELPWEKQKEFLYKVVGEITDDEVINQHEEYEFLREFLKISDVKQYRTTVNKAIKEREVSINKLQGVIEEKQRAHAPVDTLDSLLAVKEKKEAEINQLKESLKGSNEIMDKIREKQKLILEIESIREREKVSYEEEQSKAYNSSSSELKRTTEAIREIQFDISKCRESIENLEKEYKHYDEDVRSEFRARWDKVVTAALRDKDTVCPTCGRELEVDKLEEVKKDFENRRELKKKEMILESNENKAKMESIQANIKSLNEKLTEYGNEVAGLMAKEVELKAIIAQGNDFTPFDTSSFDEEVKSVQAEIDSLSVPNTSEIDCKIEAVRSEITDILFKIEAVRKYDVLQKEIEEKKVELKEMQLTLADDIRKVELSKDFSKIKAEMLEAKINSMFEKVKFKLFETQKNGEVKETCTALAVASNGALVDLKSGYANTALRIQAGIEIINSLQKHFDFYCPIIVDNRESVTELPRTDAQVISLIVSENDKELRVE